MKRKKQNPSKKEFINPFSKEEISFWANKWKVGMQIIRDAMDVTGSSRVITIKQLLSRLNYIRSHR